jgi:hypothetical protein
MYCTSHHLSTTAPPHRVYEQQSKICAQKKQDQPNGTESRECLAILYNAIAEDKKLAFFLSFQKSPFLKNSVMKSLTSEAEFLEVIGTKVLRVSSLLFTVTSTNGFYSPSPLWAKVV